MAFATINSDSYTAYASVLSFLKYAIFFLEKLDFACYILILNIIGNLCPFILLTDIPVMSALATC